MTPELLKDFLRGFNDGFQEVIDNGADNSWRPTGYYTEFEHGWNAGYDTAKGLLGHLQIDNHTGNSMPCNCDQESDHPA